MHTSNLSLVTDDYTVTGRGYIGLNGGLDLDTQIALTAAGITKMLTMAALPIPGNVPSLPAIPTRISGTIGSPDIRPDVDNLPLTAVHSLFAGAFGAGELLKDGAGRSLRSLQQDIERLW